MLLPYANTIRLYLYLVIYYNKVIPEPDNKSTKYPTIPLSVLFSWTVSLFIYILYTLRRLITVEQLFLHL